MVVWEHPLDIHLMTQSLHPWPSMLLMVYARDDSARKDMFVSYGLIGLPTSCGLFQLECRTWFAVESHKVLNRRLYGATCLPWGAGSQGLGGGVLGLRV